MLSYFIDTLGYLLSSHLCDCFLSLFSLAAVVLVARKIFESRCICS